MLPPRRETSRVVIERPRPVPTGRMSQYRTSTTTLAPNDRAAMEIVDPAGVTRRAFSLHTLGLTPSAFDSQRPRGESPIGLSGWRTTNRLGLNHLIRSYGWSEPLLPEDQSADEMFNEFGELFVVFERRKVERSRYYRDGRSSYPRVDSHQEFHGRGRIAFAHNNESGR